MICTRPNSKLLLFNFLPLLKPSITQLKRPPTPHLVDGERHTIHQLKCHTSNLASAIFFRIRLRSNTMSVNHVHKRNLLVMQSRLHSHSSWADLLRRCRKASRNFPFAMGIQMRGRNTRPRRSTCYSHQFLTHTAVECC